MVARHSVVDRMGSESCMRIFLKNTPGEAAYSAILSRSKQGRQLCLSVIWYRGTTQHGAVPVTSTHVGLWQTPQFLKLQRQLKRRQEGV